MKDASAESICATLAFEMLEAEKRRKWPSNEIVVGSAHKGQDYENMGNG